MTEALLVSPPSRGTRLPRLQTKFLNDHVAHLQRPAPTETLILNPSPTRFRPPEPTGNSRRTSRNFFALFQRHKNATSAQKNNSLISPASGNLHNGSPVIPMDMRASARPDKKTSNARPTERERSPIPLMTWDPPPLFQAYPQALKHSTLTSPTLPADAILRHRKRANANQSPPQETIDQENQDGVLKKKNRGQNPSSLHLEWITKVYVLATSGFLLQYAGDGHHDRLPERIMQLGKDSAAFASDAIPGRHWVLQINQSSADDGTVVTSTGGRSVFSRLSIRGVAKRSVSSFLLVMESAEEMDEWLVSIRKEIQSLGGKSYKPDVPTKKDPEEIIQQLKQRPSRRFLIQRDPHQFSSDPRITRQRSDRANGFSPISPSQSGTSNAETRPALRSIVSLSSIQGGSHVNRPHVERPAHATGAIQDLRIDEGAPTIRPALHTTKLPAKVSNSSDETLTSLRRGSMSSYPRSSQGSATEDSESPPPNFSVPSFSHRFSQSAKTLATLTPPTSAGAPSLTDGESARPESVLGDLPPSSHMKLSSSKANLNQEGVAVAMSLSPVKAKTIDNQLPKIVSSSSERQSIPRRLSSLEYSYGLLPWNASDKLQGGMDVASEPAKSPHRHSTFIESVTSSPPPSSEESWSKPSTPYLAPPTALPPPPPTLDANNPQTVKTNPQEADKPKLRRPASMQVQSRPSAKLSNRASLAAIRHTSPIKSQERVNHVNRLSLHGPPAAPPPSQPLPDIPAAVKFDGGPLPFMI